MPNRTVTVRLTSAGSDTGSFNIKTTDGVVLFNNITRESILSPSGLTIEIPYETTQLVLESTGVCNTQRVLQLTLVPPLVTRYYELVCCNPELPNVYTKLANTLPANRYVKVGTPNIFYVYEGAYIDQNFDPSNLDTSIVPTSGIGCA
jgi:hypothetical protein